MSRVALVKKKKFKKKVATSVMMVGLLVAPSALEAVSATLNVQAITAEAATATTVNASSEWNWNTDDGKYLGSGGAKKISLSNGDTLGFYQTSAGGDIKVHYYQTGVQDFTVGSISASATGTQTRTYDTSLFIENPVTIQLTLSITAKDVAPVETVQAPSNVGVNSAGNYISATVQAGTSTFAYDANGNMISEGGTWTDGTNAPIDLVRSLTPGEQFYVVSMNPETEVWSEKTWSTYKADPVSTSIDVIGQVVGTGEILWSDTKSGTVGSQITFSSQKVDGYTLASVLSQTITLAEDNPTVVFYYTKDAPAIKYGTLTTKHVDENGEEIADTATEQVEVGDTYTTTAPNIDGYKLLGDATKTGTMLSESGKIETFIYVKNQKEVKKGTIRMNYVDLKNNPIAEPTLHEATLGEEIAISAKDVAGYRFLGETVTWYITLDQEGITDYYFVYDKNEEASNKDVAPATNVQFVKDSNGTQISASVEQFLDFVVVQDGEILVKKQAVSIARAVIVDLTVELSRAILPGETVEYYTLDNDGNRSETGTLTLAQTEPGTDEGTDTGTEPGTNQGTESDTDSDTNTDGEEVEYANSGSQPNKDTNKTSTTTKESTKAKSNTQTSSKKLPKTGSETMSSALMTSGGLSLILAALIIFRKRFTTFDSRK
ncbi:hypothetical protein A5886_000953 [Enterococcus sp. 8G7_MSG3316]|uniref:Gram-positive cocci surface proteins LPxTG domain-containing protein n=1 Tax=Candidatus Enterococcus testudinis TaxID=1834191 RepID=A0A242A4A7_9ENTE|nr:MucBP domain-containing protein [Enterococcus sp. 8G7_MSG3316]OTN75877.1 hypothetical protein A5886_000953 [Enterococcus sp. 8G7_MSG3316]